MRKNAVQGLKQGIDIAGYARTLTTLEPKGRLLLVGSCPLPGHDDDKPSFHVFPEVGTWWCLEVCLVGGDALDLCRAVEGVRAREARIMLAQRYGAPLLEKPKRRWR